jgi:hypothetical protein
MAIHRRLLALVATGVIVAACSSTPASTGTSTPAGGATPPPTEAATTAPTEAATSGSGESQAPTADFGPAANALDNLDSYKFDVEITSASNSTFGSEGTTSFTGTVINKGTKAQQLDEVVKDANGNVTSELHFLVIGDSGWTKDTADGTYVALPAGALTGMMAGLLAFQPQKIFATAFGTLGSEYSLVGTESKNGVNSRHYHGNASIGSFFSAFSGTSGEWTSDVWLASDGGYLVSSNVSAAAATATSAGSFAINVEITNVNDPSNSLTPPS